VSYLGMTIQSNQNRKWKRNLTTNNDHFKKNKKKTIVLQDQYHALLVTSKFANHYREIIGIINKWAHS
jgi:hypothetical protein